MVRRSDDLAVRRVSAIVGASSSSARVLTATAADRRTQGLHQPKLRVRLGLQLRDGHRPLRPDVLYPVYLAQVRGYNALMIGETMFVTGVAMFLTAPIAGA